MDTEGFVFRIPFWPLMKSKVKQTGIENIGISGLYHHGLKEMGM